MVDNGIHHRSYIKSFRKTIQFASELDFGVDHLAIFTGADASFGFKKTNEVTDLIPANLESNF